MEKFNRTLRGYDPEEVNKFLDQVIKQVETMVGQIKTKDQKISELTNVENENKELKSKLEQYTRMEATFNKAIMMAQKTSDQVRMTTQRECELMVEDAKKNANRIINEALLKAEKTEAEANLLNRNINIFKRRVRGIIESQLEMVDDLDKVEI